MKYNTRAAVGCWMVITKEREKLQYDFSWLALVEGRLLILEDLLVVASEELYAEPIYASSSLVLHRLASLLGIQQPDHELGVKQWSFLHYDFLVVANRQLAASSFVVLTHALRMES